MDEEKMEVKDEMAEEETQALYHDLTSDRPTYHQL